MARRLPNETSTVKDAEAKSQVSKLKYAALGHIDLSTINFSQKDNSLPKKEGFAEKSRSVIDIACSSTQGQRFGLPLRSLTRIKEGSGMASGSLTCTESSLREGNEFGSAGKKKLQ